MKHNIITKSVLLEQHNSQETFWWYNHLWKLAANNSYTNFFTATHKCLNKDYCNLTMNGPILIQKYSLVEINYEV